MKSFYLMVDDGHGMRPATDEEQEEFARCCVVMSTGAVFVFPTSVAPIEQVSENPRTD